MSARSVDTDQERGQAVTALIKADRGISSPPPHHRRNDFAYEFKGLRSLDIGEQDRHSYKQQRQRQSKQGDDRTAVGGSVSPSEPMTASRHEIYEYADMDLCASAWQSVESLARMLVGTQSVVSTISKCYSLPNLRSERGCRQFDHRQPSRVRPEMQSSLVSDRLAADALAIFRRLGQAPLSQPDSLYINSSKMPEAAKALDPGLSDAHIAAWMDSNGFGQENNGSSVEALSWTEYRRAVSELCPAFRRFGISTSTFESTITAGDGPKIVESRAGRCAVGSPKENTPPSPPRDRRNGPFDRTDRFPTSPQGRRGIVGGGVPGRSGCGGDRGPGASPPRTPGADSFHILRRKRHAAISLDYESLTNELPQVMPPLDPCILVDHIKAQGRKERKDSAASSSRGDGLNSLWTLDPHERLTKMTLQKDQVSETANPRAVPPRQSAVTIRSRRHEFTRRKDADAEVATKVSRNVGVIARHVKIAESKTIGAARYAVTESPHRVRRERHRHKRRNRAVARKRKVEEQRVAETSRAALVRLKAAERARDHRIKTEALKECIAEQLRTIQDDEALELARVRERRRVLHKGEGVVNAAGMRRARSTPAITDKKLTERAREPWMSPSIPPPDEDARWKFCSTPQPRSLLPSPPSTGPQHISFTQDPRVHEDRSHRADREEPNNTKASVTYFGAQDEKILSDRRVSPESDPASTVRQSLYFKTAVQNAASIEIAHFRNGSKHQANGDGCVATEHSREYEEHLRRVQQHYETARARTTSAIQKKYINFTGRHNRGKSSGRIRNTQENRSSHRNIASSSGGHVQSRCSDKISSAFFSQSNNDVNSGGTRRRGHGNSGAKLRGKEGISSGWGRHSPSAGSPWSRQVSSPPWPSDLDHSTVQPSNTMPATGWAGLDWGGS